MSRQSETLRKIELQKSQIRSIMSDFRKAKHKCIVLHQELGTDFARKGQFEAIEKEITIKLDLLDVPGLVQLKNKLVAGLSELFDMEAELNTQKQRIAARREFGKLLKPAEKMPDPRTRESKNQTTQPRPKAKQPQHGQSANMGSYNVPLYHISEDSSENKVERITKYVAALKRNMKMHTDEQSAGKLKDLLMQDPDFLAMKAEVARLRKEKEQLQAKFKTVGQQAVQSFIQRAEVVEECAAYKTIRIYNPSNASTSTMPAAMPIEPKTQILQSPQAQIQAEAEPPRRLRVSNLQQQIELIRQKRKDAEIIQIQKELQKQQYNVEAVVSRISSTLENNEQRLRKLRQQRMRIFEKEQDIWSELEQV